LSKGINIMGTEDKEKTMAFFDALTDALGDSEGVSKEEIVSDLKEEGIDVDASAKRILAMVEHASQKAKRQQLDFAREERLALESKKPTRLGEFLDWTKEQIIEKIHELLPTRDPLASVSYRDLKSKSQEDLAALLEDLITAKKMADQERHDES
jgi:hypothetical protein